MRFPAGSPDEHRDGRPHGAERTTRRRLDGAEVRLALSTRRLAYGVRVHAPGFTPDDDAFSLEPGRERVVRLRAGRPAPCSRAASSRRRT